MLEIGNEFSNQAITSEPEKKKKSETRLITYEAICEILLAKSVETPLHCGAQNVCQFLRILSSEILKKTYFAGLFTQAAQSVKRASF